jgi:hypothetical protein
MVVANSFIIHSSVVARGQCINVGSFRPITTCLYLLEFYLSFRPRKVASTGPFPMLVISIPSRDSA